MRVRGAASIATEVERAEVPELGGDGERPHEAHRCARHARGYGSTRGEPSLPLRRAEPHHDREGDVAHGAEALEERDAVFGVDIECIERSKERPRAKNGHEKGDAS